MKKKTQKDTRKILIITCIIIAAIIVQAIPAIIIMLIARNTSSESVVYEGFTCELKKKDGFIYNYMWDGTPETMDIYIPDEVQGRKITAIGGYLGRGLPLPFHVEVPYKDDGGDDIHWPGDYADYEEMENSDKNYGEYKTYTFTVHLGKNISRFKTQRYDDDYAVKRDEHGDIEKIYFKVEYKYVVDPENQYIESIDGKLSYK